MPANLGVDKTSLFDDLRFKAGRYIEDGQELYYVLGTETQPAPIKGGAPFVRLLCERCLDNTTVELDMVSVRRRCRTVTPAHDS